MSKLRLSDLEHDLQRKRGEALTPVVLELLSRGRNGRLLVARALQDEQRCPALPTILAERSGQVTEMLTQEEGFVRDEVAVLLLKLVPQEELARKAQQMWQRGERERGLALAQLVPEQDLALVVRGLAALEAGEAATAENLLRTASCQGVPLEQLWRPWGRALYESGAWPAACQLYLRAYRLDPQPAVAHRAAQLLVDTLLTYRPAALSQLVQELTRWTQETPDGGAGLVQALGQVLTDQAHKEMELVDRSWEQLLAAWRQLTVSANPESWVTPREASTLSTHLTYLDHVIQALGPLRREPVSVAALLAQLGSPAKETEALVSRLLVDGEQWRRAWNYLGLVSGASRLLELTEAAGQVSLVVTQDEGRELPPPAWELAGLILRRHLGRLERTPGGFRMDILASPPVQVGELLARQLLDEPLAVSPRACLLAEGTAGVWHGLHLVMEETRGRLWGQRRPALAALLGYLQKALQEAPASENATAWRGYVEHLLVWLHQDWQLGGKLPGEYVHLDSLVKAAQQRWMGEGRSNVELRLPFAPLPRVRLDAKRTALMLDVLVSHLALRTGQGGALQLAEVPQQGVLRLEACWDAAAAPLALPARALLEQLAGAARVGLDWEEDAVVLAFPQSSVEGELAQEITGLERLDPAARQALRAAVALGQEPDSDPAMVRFLMGKAVEVEVTKRLGPHLERHSLLPAANRKWLTTHAGEIAQLLQVADARGIKNRCQSVENAIIKDRLRKSLEDWRNLAVALAGFGLTFSGERIVSPGWSESQVKQTAPALYRVGDELGGQHTSPQLVPAIYRLLSALAQLPVDADS